MSKSWTSLTATTTWPRGGEWKTTTIYFKIEKVKEEQVKLLVKGVEKYVKKEFPDTTVWVKEVEWKTKVELTNREYGLVWEALTELATIYSEKNKQKAQELEAITNKMEKQCGDSS